ncbi:uncharacterized protein LOC120206973 isoform X2 [Hibiscus syriacus]|uniref:uncharacterized protein LOC120206973 isoform X2 n=1 Tax=Hibiscus syriacus TaxID=106335 RepID=UPI001923E26B|nr:uncharacterized protein LOC120206973 isoform X2 [Hibiscus syriacus]
MIHQEMDIDEWVFLPDDRFLDIKQDSEKQIQGEKRVSDTNLVFLADYFNKEEPPPHKQLVPVPFPLEPRILKVPENDQGKIVEKINDAGAESVEGDREVKTQVSFRKPSYNNESVDMTNKMDSPRSTTKGAIPQLDAAGTFNFDEEDDEFLQNISSPRLRDSFEKKAGANWEENSGPGDLWKWSLTGIGAICSFGVAAATFCIIIFGTQQRQKQHQQNQKLLFQRYTDDKVIKLHDGMSVNLLM